MLLLNTSTILYLKFTLVNASSALARSLWPPPFHLVSKKDYLWQKEEPKLNNSKNIYWHERPANLPLAVYDLLYMVGLEIVFSLPNTACILASYIPAYIWKLIRPYIPARPLRSATSGRLVLPPCHTSCSGLLSVLAPRWWNDLPVDVRTQSLTTFKRRLKTHLFRLHLSLSPSPLWLAMKTMCML